MHMWHDRVTKVNIASHQFYQGIKLKPYNYLRDQIKKINQTTIAFVTIS